MLNPANRGSAFSGWLWRIPVLALLLVQSPAFASNNYYDDTTTNDILENVFGDGGCTGCHLSTGNDCIRDGSTDTAFMSYTRVAGTCYDDIIDKLGATNFAPGDRMPQGGPYTDNATYISLLGTWSSLGRPLAPPTVSTTSANTITKTGASLRGTFNYNVYSGTSVPGEYRFRYNTSASTIGSSLTSWTNDTGTTNETDSRSISGLSCGTTYWYRGEVRNGGSSIISGSWVSFSTSSCTPPVITQGASTGVIMSEDGNPTPFSLTLNATDNDPGTLQWTINSQGSNGTAGIGGDGIGTSEPITYSPTLNYTGSDSFVVRVRNATTTLTDFITVNVTVNPIDDPPVIDQGAGPLAQTIDEDNSPTAFSLTLTATDNDTPAIGLSWSISSAASNGVAAPAGDGSGTSEAISYTPNANFNGSDSFTVQVFDGASPDTITVNVTIDPRNDAPVINPVGAQNGTEGQLVTINPVVVDPDDPNDGTQLGWSFVSGQQPGMTISAQGQILWTPPLGPPAVFNQMYPITIRVQDGLEHGSVPDDESFTLTINPPDQDADVVADYDDFCLTVPDGTNADNDGDGVAGTDGGANTGGDVCDLDDDNDGMPDLFELAEGFDPFDAADAAQDADGDTISNLQEFLDGTNPNFANLTIDATGYLTPFDLPRPDPTTVHPAATTAEPDDPGPYRPGRNTIVWSGSNASNVLLGTSNQTLDVRPLVNFGANQQVEEGGAVTVDVMLNGDPPSYPVTVNYTVTGTANNPADHDAANGVVTFTTPNISETIVFNVAADVLPDAGETVVFTLDSATNAVIGSNNVHRVEIVEANVAPRVTLQFTQGGDPVGSAYAADGAIDIDALVTDVNAGQTFTYDWSRSDAAFVDPGDVANWQVTPMAGNYLIDVTVTDSAGGMTRVSRILNVAAGGAPALGMGDSDGDGMADNSPMEGYADDDGDSIPNYLDAHNGGGSDGNLVPDQTIDINTSFLLQTDTGLALSRGSTAQAAGQFGALLTETEIELFGSVNGGPPVNPDDSYDHVGGIYDFQVSGLEPGSSARVVIPLLSAVPRNAEYRKFNPATGWGSFVIDGNNAIATAPGELGACPEPGHASYRSGLNYLDNCLQLTIEDYGPNDTDNELNGVVADPGAVGVRLTEPAVEAVEDGGGRVSPWLLIWFALLTLAASRRRRNASGH